MISRVRCRHPGTLFGKTPPTPDVNRTTLPGAQLYAILDREFKMLRPAGCAECPAPLPYWRVPPDDVSANWHIGQPRECPHGCHLVVAELLARLWTRYDIEPQLEQ
jgi:hypothetical protein